jgi:DeoR/GlpR family transcriptional regulator of sugar metabolism
MLATERKLFIMKMLNEKSIISFKEIAAALDASEVTVRRDLEKLENAGKLKRIPGGAALENYLDSVEMTMEEKTAINLGAKQRVAQRASELVTPGECVFLDGGTSVACMMDSLSRMNVTIVTYNQLVLRKLVNPTARIHIIGGHYLPHYVMNVGPEAQEQLQHYHFDAAFLGCSGVVLEQNMSFVTNMDSLLMKQIAMQNSSRNYLLLDSTKFQKPSFVKFSALDAFDLVLCDKGDETVPHKQIEFV